MIQANIKIKSNFSNIKAKSPELRQKTVNYVASELLRKSDPYVPFDTGMLRDSGISHSVPAQGKLIWRTPYAKNQWHNGSSNGLRGRKWALRAWADYKKIILANANQILSGKVQI